MARSLWSGSISFGLVTIPVRMFTAEREHEVHFHQLNKDTGHRIRYRKVDDETGDEVDSDEIVKGFEVSKGKWVTFTDEEIEEIRPQGTHTLDIEDFVDLAEIDPIYYDKTYYLAPDENLAARRAYALLLEAMEDRQRAAIGTVVIRNKPYLAAVRPYQGLLAMSTMRFADEVVDPGDIEDLDFDVPKVDANSKKMAVTLLDSLATSFDPSKYHDTYTEELCDRIERKAKGETLDVPETPQPASNVVDLMAALQASVEAARGRRSGAGAKAASSGSRNGAAATSKAAGKPAARKAAKSSATKSSATKPSAKKAGAKSGAKKKTGAKKRTRAA